MSESDQRALRREFIRRHHPDRGGDPVAFGEGLRRMDDAAAGRRPRVVVVPTRRWPVRLLAALSAPLRHHHRKPRVL